MRTSLVLVAAFVALSLASCGDDDGNGSPTDVPPASTEDVAYYEELASVMEDARTDFHVISQTLTAGFDPASPEEESLAASQTYGRDYEQFTATRREAIAALVAPESLVSLHQALVAAAEEGFSLAEDLNAELAGSPVPGSLELTALYVEFDGATIVQRFRDACSDLQRRATDSGSDVDLGCNE